MSGLMVFLWVLMLHPRALADLSVSWPLASAR
jgi:hypothetical protein